MRWMSHAERKPKCGCPKPYGFGQHVGSSGEIQRQSYCRKDTSDHGGREHSKLSNLIIILVRKKRIENCCKASSNVTDLSMDALAVTTMFQLNTIRCDFPHRKVLNLVRNCDQVEHEKN